MEQKNPYAAPSARVADVVGAGEFVLAERGTRLAAQIVDGICVIVLVVIAVLGAPGMFNDDPGAQYNPVAVAIAGIGFVALFIYNLVLLAQNGQTLGKKVLGVKIVRQDGSKAGLGRIFWLRIVVSGLLGAIPVAGPFYSLLDALFIFGQARRCIHDRIADTIVIVA